LWSWQVIFIKCFLSFQREQWVIKFNSALKASYPWRHAHKLGLQTNMRFHLQGNRKGSMDARGLISFPHNLCNVAVNWDAENQWGLKHLPQIQGSEMAF
jgi:hypothetical protein